MLLNGQRQLGEGRVTRMWRGRQLVVGTSVGLNLHTCSQPTPSNILFVNFNRITNQETAKPSFTDYSQMN
ncbi:MAG: hypothetical protein AB1757_05170 [Acidobacteriota bacterium]